MSDIPILYRENILDILDLWAGYPVKYPCSFNPAINAGIVELRCFINNVCPFHASPLKEDALVFNDRTFERIKPWFPDHNDNVLTYTPGAEGIHFIPKYVYRNNYIYKLDIESVPQNSEGKRVFPPNTNIYTTHFDQYFKEITYFKQTTSPTPGADQTRYRAEQSWLIMPSVFDNSVPMASSDMSEECSFLSEWNYINMKVSKSEIDDYDVMYDYKADYYDKYRNSIDLSTGNLKEGEKKPYILPLHVQVPTQVRIRDGNNRGIHWRLHKRTPLYRGEDFFIRFYKKSKDTTVNPNKTETPSFSDRNYDYLDVTVDKEIIMKSGTNLKRPASFAVRGPTQGNEQPDLKSYNFYNQAYYVIELGMDHRSNHYFIIITERASPIFVGLHMGEGVVGSYWSSQSIASKKYSTFDKIIGDQLINANYFDITVRNHLGSLIIQFNGDGLNNIPPWTIKRLDWKIEIDPISNEPTLVEKNTPLFVPRGRMSIWGGNIRSGFIFGPLQYRHNYTSFIYPPRDVLAINELDMAFDNSVGPEEIPYQDIKGSFKTNPFFLPTLGDHHLLFSATDIYLEDFYKHVIPVGVPTYEQSLFTQDAQFYKEYHEEKNEWKSSDYEYGGFFYDYSIKELPDPTSSPIHYKTSNIVAKKYKYLNDPKTRHQAFDIWIGMMCGDHMFTDLYWDWLPGVSTLYKPRIPSDDRVYNTFEDLKMVDDVWFLPNCKTPILTSMRLVSDASDELRWEDGTTVKSGISYTPFDNVSPYYLDASDHVMVYSDEWSATDFSQIQHTGTLQFYLNRGVPLEKNITDYLVALQNKTFYVEIWVGYKNCNYTNVPGFYKLFTGLCHGGKIDYEYGKIIMSCKVEDYTAVLSGMRFFNSPWFDGMKDINAINEIIQMAGFRNTGKYDPGTLIKNLSAAANARNRNTLWHHFDGRLFSCEPYALPSAYNRLDQPAFKFNDGEPFMDAITKICTKAAKVFFFDEFGIAHYEEPQDIIQRDYLGLVPLVPLYQFTTNPEKYGGQLIFNKVERSYNVEGVINHIKIMSNTPDMHLLIYDDIDWKSVENPDVEGFLGYPNTGYQQEGLFGSKEAVLSAMRKYKVMNRPKINMKFETYGVPLRSNDIISVNNETTRVVKVSHTIRAEKNEWWMEVECEKYQPVMAPKSTI